MLTEEQKRNLRSTIAQMDEAEKRELARELEDDLTNGRRRPSPAELEALFAEMDAIRARAKPGPPSIVELIREGRRY